MELQGTQGVDTLTGGADSDTIYGYGGNDTLKGGAGDDVLAGNDGADILQGGDGDDYMLGGAGNDTLDGGAGNDWAAYEDATAGVKVDLNLTGTQNTVGAGTDRLTSIENLYGSAFNDTLTGNAEANMLVGGAGNDTVSGGKGDDTLWGSAGNDTLDGGDGDDYLVGGLGDDVIKGGAGWDWSSYEDATAGVTVDLNKTTAQNTGGGGTDTITGVEHLYGTKFNDILTGDAKDNYLWGDAGDDKLVGGAGDDHLSGGVGADVIDGGDGFDTVDYGFSTKSVYVDLKGTSSPGGGDYGELDDRLTSIEAVMGSSFGDVIYGNAAENYLYGDAGNDLIQGYAGNDTIDGGDGDDHLFSSAVQTNGEILLGGAGDDYLVATYADGMAIMDGGEGVDTLAVYSDANVTVDLRISGEQQVTAGLRLDIRGIENVDGSRGNDHLIGDAKDNTFWGGMGNDVIEGGDGNDTASYWNGYDSDLTIDLGKTVQVVSGQHGADTLISIENVIGVAIGHNVLTGNSGVNRLTGGLMADTLTAAGGNDVLNGGDGNDRLIATKGMAGDQLFGGYGDDTLIAFGDGAKLDGGAGADTVDYSGAGIALNIVLLPGVGPTDGFGKDTLIGIENVIGGVHDDVITGDNGANVLSGGDGRDALWGNDGDDVLNGGAGSDWLFGNSGNDVLLGGAGDDQIDGGDGIDFVSYLDDGVLTGVSVDLRLNQQDLGARGIDFMSAIENIIGTRFDDHLIGNGGANVLIGGDGNDVLEGGEGDDTVMIGSFNGATKFIGGGGSDTVDFGYQVNGVGLTGGVMVNLTSAQPYFVVDYVQLSMSSVENLLGTNYNDIFTGDAADNLLVGRGGDDTLYAGDGNDRLEGGAGNDYLSGDAGADVLIGGAGRDVLNGGDGADTYVFNDGDSASSLVDFNALLQNIDIISRFESGDRIAFNGPAGDVTNYMAASAGTWEQGLLVAQQYFAQTAGRYFTLTLPDGAVILFADTGVESATYDQVVGIGTVNGSALDYTSIIGI